MHKLKRKKAAAFMEYAILIGTVTLAFSLMNFYIKRGVQGRVKELADQFISNSQVDVVMPETTTTSSSNTLQDSNLSTQAFTGGGTRTTLNETRNSGFNSQTIDEQGRQSLFALFTPWQSGDLEELQRGEHGDYSALIDNYVLHEDYDEYLRTETDPGILELERDRLREEARILDEKAQLLEDMAEELRREAFSAPELLQRADELENRANQMHQQADDLRAQADRAQARINELRGQG